MSNQIKGPTRNLNVISLLLGAEVNPISLHQMMHTAKQGGACGLELTYQPGLLTAGTATILEATHTFPITGLCVFFGNGDYNPLIDNDRAHAMVRVMNAIDLAAAIGKESGVIPVVTGPFAFQIGTQYDRRDTSRTTEKIVEYLKTLGDYAQKNGVKLAHECLQAAENFAIQGFAHHMEIISKVGMMGVVGEHTDTFHLDLWGVDASKHIITNHEMINWFHVSGSSRHSPGHGSDHIAWQAIADTLNDVGTKFPICFEGFSPEFRKAVPEIGRAYPKDLQGPVALAQAIWKLREVGMISGTN